MMKQEKGLVSVLLIYILVPILTVAIICVDASRVLFAKQTVTIANEIALDNMLGNYNADLKKIYGLFASASNEKIEEELVSYWLRGIRGSLSVSQNHTLTQLLMQKSVIDRTQWQAQTQRKSSSSMTNLNGIVIEQRPIITPVPNTTLYEPSILKYQIVEYMKYRGLMYIESDFLKKIGVFKNQHVPTKQNIEQLRNEQKNQDTLQVLYRLKEPLVHLKDKGTQVFDFLDTPSFIATINSHHSPQDFFNGIKEKWLMYDAELSKVQLKVDQIALSDNEQFIELKKAIDREKDAVSTYKKALDSVEVVEDNVVNVNDVSGHKPIKFMAKIKHDVSVMPRELHKNPTFIQMTLPEKQDTTVSVEKSIKDVYHHAKTKVSLENSKVPQQNSQSVAVGDEVLPTRKNVISDTISRLQHIVGFFTKAQSISDVFQNVVNELLVGEYATGMFSNYLDRLNYKTPVSKQTLLNGIPLSHINSVTRGAEVEYLLFGKQTAIENVEAALSQIRLIRFVFNLAFTYTNASLRSLIFTSSLVAGPFAKALDIFLHVMVALAETQMDEQLLLHGKAVPIVKTVQMFKMQPTQVASGVLSFASDTIKQKVNDSVDVITNRVNEWFDGQIHDVERQVTEKVTAFISEQEAHIKNKISEKIESILQPLLVKHLETLQAGNIELEIKIAQGFKAVEEKLVTAVSAFSTENVLEPIAKLMKQNIQHLQRNYTQLVMQLLKEQKQNVGDLLQKVIGNYLEQFTQPIRNSVVKLSEAYTGQARTIVRSQTKHLSQQAKGQLAQLTEQFLSTTRQQLQTHAYGGMNTNVSLTYPDYLKLFMVIELVSVPNSPIYTRMAQLIGQNMHLNLQNYYTVYTINSTYKVDTIFLDWFKQVFVTGQTEGY